MIRRLVLFSTAIALVLVIAFVTYFSVTYLFPPAEKPVSNVFQQFGRNESDTNPLIKPGTIVRIETKYACGDNFTEFQGPANEQLSGLSEKQLSDMYSPDAGWEISQLSGGIIQLSRTVKELCERHSQYRHLGVYQDMLAVYEGPLGYNESLLRVEKNIPLNSLPADFSVKLRQAMDFKKQADTTKLDLRRQLEFPNEKVLNTALDSIDEMNQGSATH